MDGLEIAGSPRAGEKVGLLIVDIYDRLGRHEWSSRAGNLCHNPITVCR